MPASPPIYNTIQKRNKNKTVLVLVIILLVTAAMYCLAFDWMVPKMAAFTIPQKWRIIPLRQPKDIVHNYFGESLPEHINGSDKWANGSNGKMYFLRIHYLADTVAVSYSIHYQFKNRIASRDYVVDTGSIR